MEDFSQERMNDLVLHGNKNQSTAQRFQNWCRNARIVRSGGIGLVEQLTGVPIGHMGIECDHAPESGMHSWNLEDAAINFYLANCANCDKRSPGTGPSIEPLIQDYQKSEKKRREAEHSRKAHEEQQQAEKLAQIECLRIPGDSLANQIVDLLVAIVEKADDKNTDALVELASLAPETFPIHIIEFMKAQVDNGNHRLELPAARTLLVLPIPEDVQQKLTVKVASKHSPDACISKFLQETAHKLSNAEIGAVLPNCSLLARPVGGFPYLEPQSNSGPLLAIAEHHPKVVMLILEQWLKSRSNFLMDAAFRAISVLTVTNSEIVEPFVRDVVAKLLRRRYLLPGYDRESASDRLQVLRSTARRLFRSFPTQGDNALQSLLMGADKTALSEAARVYSGVLEKEWNEAVNNPGEAEKIAFRRILWMAVDDPVDSMDNNATHFFSHVRSELLPIAANHVDGILGAAATLSSRLDDQESEQLLDVPNTGLEALERHRKRNAICLFQANLIAWAFRAVAGQGLAGVQRVLTFYEALPGTEIEMRASVVEHLWKLMTNTETVTAVIPHLYGAMTSPEALVRGSAARSVSEVSHEVRRDLPGLIFEVYLVLLSDPNVYVHKRAARSVKVYDFPENLKGNVAWWLVVLIKFYIQKGNEQSFVVDVLRKYVQGCLTDTQLSGDHGRFVISIIDQLDEVYLDSALNSLGHQLTNTPGIVRLCIKALGRSFVDYHGRDRALQILDIVPSEFLNSSVTHLLEAAPTFATTRPYVTNSLIVLLCKAGCWNEAREVCTDVLSNIGDTRRELLLRYHYEGLRQVCEFECGRAREAISLTEANQHWSSLQKETKDEEADRDARKSFRPFFFE